MRLHLLGLPHTVSDEAHSHCAYTSKVVKFPKMMRPLGYEIIHYGVEGAQTEAHEQVDVISRDEQHTLLGRKAVDPTKFIGDEANVGNRLYRVFNAKLRAELVVRVEPGDLVLLPFGHGHGEAVTGMGYTCVESGIGYPELTDLAAYRIFESYAWLHYHLGKAQRPGKNYEWVIPNYFDLDAWDVELDPPQDEVVFLGRLCSEKGLAVVDAAAAALPRLHFTVCGQGDATPYLKHPNITYRAPIVGRERSAYLGHARAVIMPTMFVEPFGGVAVEAQLCGTPVVGPDFGAFTETIENEVSGYRCRTLGDYVAGIEMAVELDRKAIADKARARWGLGPVGLLYDDAFKTMTEKNGAPNWYALSSRYWRGHTVPEAPVSPPDMAAWQAAQAGERKFHVEALDWRPAEAVKRAAYAELMGIGSAPHGKVLDIGCGPESLLLVTPHAAGSAGLDPLRFTDEDEAKYAAHGITRFIQPAEEPLPEDAGVFDEAWVYNCLQHTIDPAKVLDNLKGRVKVVRIFEWCNIPTDTLHLHMLTVEKLREWMAGWRCIAERTDRFSDDVRSLHGDYYCGVFVAKE